MNIKEKLLELGINLEIDKNAINVAKDELNKHGFKILRATSKIDKKAEKILENIFLVNNTTKKEVKAPATIKNDDVKPDAIEIKNIISANKEVIQNNKNITNDNKENNASVINNTTFWKDKPLSKFTVKYNNGAKINKNTSLNTKSSSNIDGANNENNNLNNNIVNDKLNSVENKSSYQNKADSQNTSNNQVNQNNYNKQNNQGSQNNLNRQNKQNNYSKQNNSNNQNKQNYFRNQNNNQQNNKFQFKNNNQQNSQFKFNNKNTNVNTNSSSNSNNKQNNNKSNQNKQFNQNSQNKKITLNQNNASIAIGTTNRFEGKMKDKAKQYNKENDNKKTTKSRPNAKTDKYKPTINNYDNEDVIRKKKKNSTGAFIKPPEKVEIPAEDIKLITLAETISIKEFSSKLKLLPSVIIKKLFLQGKIVTPNTEITFEEAENIAVEYDILCEKEKKVDRIADLLKDEEEDDVNSLESRPPVVCVMGHVDHGKTSILDVIRNTNVIAKEAGGITQHIGAYQVKVNDRLITFLDTPGHEAFTAMRLRGAKSTDIAILVVAADDGVKPQTIEAINHAKAANVEVIVAINKIDKEDANIDRVKQSLSELGLVPEDWGGSTMFFPVSAKKNIGINELLEGIILNADVLELKANPNRIARGIVIEAELDKGKGPVARVLVQKGTLKVGDLIAMGSCYGKVRGMIDCNGNRIKQASPSTPVEILGLNDVPQAGDTFVCFNTEKEARTFANTFISVNKQKLVEASKHKVTLDALFEQIKAGEVKELPIIIKTDVAGSSEALRESLEKLSNEEVTVRVIHEGVGNISESDVNLAIASNAIIIGFSVKADQNVKSIIDKEKIDLRIYDIIYKAIEDVEKAMKGMLAPVYEEKIIGHIVIRQVFKASNIGNIAGCYVNDGEINRNSKVRLFRNDNKIFEGSLNSLKRFKDEAKEVKAGFECGVIIEGFQDYQIDDTMEIYTLIEKKIQ